MTVGKAGKLALLWRGNRRARGEATAQNNRLNRVFEAHDRTRHSRGASDLCRRHGRRSARVASETRRRACLGRSDFRWAEPDPIRCDVAGRRVKRRVGQRSSDVILKMGVKEVLYRTKHLGWGTDTHLYRTARAFNEEFSQRLQSAGPRVLKQNRGNGGQGVWKAELVSAAVYEAAIVRVLHARRGSVPEEMPLGDFMRSCEAYFANEGCIVDQPFQPRLRDGMTRCYMARTRSSVSATSSSGR
jgi:hypothetical protein